MLPDSVGFGRFWYATAMVARSRMSVASSTEWAPLA